MYLIDTHLNVSVNTYQQVDLRLTKIVYFRFSIIFYKQIVSACNDAKGIVTAMYNHMWMSSELKINHNRGKTFMKLYRSYNSWHVNYENILQYIFILNDTKLVQLNSW